MARASSEQIEKQNKNMKQLGRIFIFYIFNTLAVRYTVATCRLENEMTTKKFHGNRYEFF